MGVHTAGLGHGQAEEPVVKEISTFHEGPVLQVALAIPPALRVAVVVLLGAPARQRDLLHVVHACGLRLVPSGLVVGPGIPASHAPDCDSLDAMELVVHHIHPAGRDLRGLIVLILRLLCLLHLRHRPGVDLLRDGDHGQVLHSGLGLARGLAFQEEATEQAGLGVSKVPVRHGVAPQDDDASWVGRHLERLSILVERPQLQGALDRAEAVDEHEPVPDEGRQPGGGLLHAQLWRLVRGHTCLVHQANSPRGAGEAKCPQALIHDGGRLCQCRVDLREARGSRALRVWPVELHDPCGTLSAEQALDHQLRRAEELACTVALLYVLASLLHVLFRQAGVKDAKALALQATSYVHADPSHVSPRKADVII
mmetsp:Transcript_70294/g.227594  ORF Transcript_70294/g.227594 Transcript_70294/m.227594 type:complete len:368 (+) Transcript_70294:2430-3533(+)